MEAPKSQESQKIKCPDNIDIIRSLQNKLTEYKERLKMEMAENPNVSPEVFADTNYKIAITEKLLMTGEVDVQELSRELSEKYGNLRVEKFNNAVGVIEDYTKTGGKGVSGGTGFSAEKPAQQEKKIDLSNVDNFDKLIEVIEKSDGVQGSSQFFTPEMLKDVISKVRSGEAGLNAVTSTGGLRSKVSDLLQIEKIKQSL